MAGVRSWYVGGFRNYLSLYRILPDAIEDLAVVHGTQDLEAALSQDAAPAPVAKPKPSPGADKSAREAKVEEAVATGRWATGFSP